MAYRFPVRKLKPLAWLPNQVGFKFIGIRHDGTEVECEIELKDHLHVIKDNMYDKLKGWRDK